LFMSCLLRCVGDFDFDIFFTDNNHDLSDVMD
jgi:hypothetical protein